MNQRDYQSSGAGVSQCDAILAELQAKSGEWVEMPSLVTVSGSHNIHSRISDLRRRGHLIAQKSERVQGKVFSFYKLSV